MQIPTVSFHCKINFVSCFGCKSVLVVMRYMDYSLFTSQSFSVEKTVTVEHKLLRHILGTFGCFRLHQGELVPIFWMPGKET